MRYFLVFLMLLCATLFVAGCGDDKPTEPDNTVKPQRILVTAGTSAPPMNNAASSFWDVITPNAVSLSTLISPAPVSAGIATIADTVKVQALTYNDTLYLRISWADNTHDVWRDAFYVIDTAVPPGDTATNFDIYEPRYEEDQLWVLFSGLANGDLDGLNWRALTTDSAFLAEGVNVHNDSVLISDAGTFAVARLNYNLINPNLPLYFHPDTSAYTGYMLFEDLDISDTNTDTSLVEANIFIRGWTLNQKVPNYIIDSSLWRRTKVERGSRWDTRAISDWGALGPPDAMYNVVLCRPMNTGYADDVALNDSVKTMIGVFNDQLNFNLKGSERAFTKEFWLIF